MAWKWRHDRSCRNQLDDDGGARPSGRIALVESMSRPPRRVRSLANSLCYRLASVLPVAQELADHPDIGQMGNHPGNAYRALQEATMAATALAEITNPKGGKK